MKSGWKKEALGDLCDLYQPKTVSRKALIEDGAFPVFGANGIIGRYDQYNHEEPQLLITCRGATCGSVNRSLPKSWITGNAMVVRPKTQCLDLDYLEYFCKGRLDFSKVITGSAQPQITRKSLSPVEVSFPSISEQKRIVAILDEAFARIEKTIANTGKNLANVRELFEGYLSRVFGYRDGWNVWTLDNLCHIARGGSPRPIKSFLTQAPDGINWIKISDATASSKYIYETKQKIRPEGIKRSRMVYEGDFLLSNSMSFGRPYIMRTSGCIHDGWLVLRDKAALYDQDYLYYFLASPEAFHQFDLRASGSTVRNLNIDLVRSIEIPLPPLKQQRRLAASIEELFHDKERLEGVWKRKLSALSELKQTLLQRAFSGELTADRAECEVESATA